MLRKSKQQLIIKITIKMTEEKNNVGTTQTKVELQIIPCEPKDVQTKDHISQDDGCNGKLILSITCDGSKLTKADAGRFSEYQEEIWVTVKSTKADAGKMPDIDVSIHERCGSKMTKADSGIV